MGDKKIGVKTEPFSKAASLVVDRNAEKQGIRPIGKERYLVFLHSLGNDAIPHGWCQRGDQYSVSINQSLYPVQKSQQPAVSYHPEIGCSIRLQIGHMDSVGHGPQSAQEKRDEAQPQGRRNGQDQFGSLMT